MKGLSVISNSKSSSGPFKQQADQGAKSKNNKKDDAVEAEFRRLQGLQYEILCNTYTGAVRLCGFINHGRGIST